MGKIRSIVVGIGLAVVAATACGADAASTRAAFLRVIERPRVPLAAEVREIATTPSFAKVHVSIAADAQQRVPGHLLKPLETAFAGKRPAVIVLHGTGGTKERPEVVGIAERLAQRGFIAVTIDGRYHGERTRAGSGVAEYNAAIARAWRTGKEHPFYYDTVWDVMRFIDYLATRPDVDAARIGLTGISKGGIETYFTAAADTRVAAAVPFIGVQSFRWGLDNGQWRARIATIQHAFDAAAADAKQAEPGVDFVRAFYDRVVPGIYGEFDGPAMLSATAPRPLLVINGDSDANTPLAGVRLAVDTARPAYAALGAADKLQLRVQENTGHQVLPESVDAAVEWFVRWLQP